MHAHGQQTGATGNAVVEEVEEQMMRHDSHLQQGKCSREIMLVAESCQIFPPLHDEEEGEHVEEVAMPIIPPQVPWTPNHRLQHIALLPHLRNILIHLCCT